MTDTIERPAAADPQLQARELQPYVAVARAVTDGVAAAVDGAFPELFAWLRARDVAPAGPPFIRTRALDRAGEPSLLEMGVPVVPGMAGDEEVVAGALPGGTYATLVHVGPYRSSSARDLAAARATLLAWMTDRGLVYGHAADGGGTELACCVERLLLGPVEEPDFTKWVTELAYLVAR